MITVVTEHDETVSGSPAMVARLIPRAQTVLGEVSEADRMRAAQSGGHPWRVRLGSAA